MSISAVFLDLRKASKALEVDVETGFAEPIVTSTPLRGVEYLVII